MSERTYVPSELPAEKFSVSTLVRIDGEAQLRNVMAHNRFFCECEEVDHQWVNPHRNDQKITDVETVSFLDTTKRLVLAMDALDGHTIFELTIQCIVSFSSGKDPVANVSSNDVICALLGRIHSTLALNDDPEHADELKELSEALKKFRPYLEFFQRAMKG